LAIEPPAKSLRQRALEYLAKREYSYTELGRKLSKYAEASDDVPALLEDFKARGWLSDARFTEQIIQARQSKFGSAKIAHELREKGIADELVSNAIAQVKISEFDNACEVWRKKFKAPPATRDAWAKQARFLQGRGFGFEMIKKVLSAVASQAEND